MFHSLLITVEMLIMPVLCRRKPSSGVLRFWAIKSAGLWQWVNIEQVMVKLIA